MKIPFLNKINLTCCKATLLMEEQNANTISFTNKIKLKIHVLICKWCRAYKKQLNIIDVNLRLKRGEEQIKIEDVKLDEFKDKINKKLKL